MSTALHVLQSSSEEVVEAAVETIAQKFFDLRAQLGAALIAGEVNRATIKEQQQEIRRLESAIAEINRDQQNSIVELRGGRVESLAEILEQGLFWERCICKDAACLPIDPCRVRELAYEADHD